MEPGHFVSFNITQKLTVLLRAGKHAKLGDCLCEIPSLKISADSVNEAYSKISAAFEPTRRSHSGNVFRCVFMERPDGLLEPLENQRERTEANPPAEEQPDLLGQ